MNHEIRCDWKDRYPLESCPTHIQNANGGRNINATPPSELEQLRRAQEKINNARRSAQKRVVRKANAIKEERC